MELYSYGIIRIRAQPQERILQMSDTRARTDTHNTLGYVRTFRIQGFNLGQNDFACMLDEMTLPCWR